VEGGFVRYFVAGVFAALLAAGCEDSYEKELEAERRELVRERGVYRHAFNVRYLLIPQHPLTPAEFVWMTAYQERIRQLDYRIGAVDDQLANYRSARLTE
jgi:hypothetical protein